MSDLVLRAAVRIACGRGDLHPPPAPGGIDVGAVLRLLSGNKVPLVAAAEDTAGRDDPLWRSISQEPAVAEALGRESARRSLLLEAYAAAARALRESGCEAVLFKSPGWFPYLSSNLDVLVPESSFQEAARRLAGMGHLRLPHYREDHKLLFRTFEGGRPSLSVHLHEKISWGKVVIAGGEEVVGRGVAGADGAALYSAPEDALAAALAHTILETDQVRLSDLRIAVFCLDHGASVGSILSRAERDRWHAAAAAGLALYDAAMRRAAGEGLLAPQDAGLVEEAVARRPWVRRLLSAALAAAGSSFPLALPRRFSKEHLVRLILGDDRRDPETKVVDLAASAWNLVANRSRLRCRPASVITISGPDGAGKSRLAEEVASILSLCEVPVQRVWSRGGFSSLAVAAKAAARRLAPGSLPKPADEPGKRAFLRSRWRRAAWVAIVCAEQALSLQRVRVWRWLGRTVVCDRWVHDTIADLAARSREGLGDPLLRDAASLLLGAAPRTDVAFLIEVSADVAHARKQDGTSVEARRDLAAAYREIAEATPLVRLDGEAPFESLAQIAVTRALRRIFERFEVGAP